VLRGRCACNAIAYEVDDAFVAPFNCHCSNCRATTGSAFLPWGEIEREKLRVTKGAGSLLVIGDPDTYHELRCESVPVASLLDCARLRICPRSVWLTDRRANAQADSAHVRRLEGSVASDPRRPPSARRIPVVLMTNTEPRHI